MDNYDERKQIILDRIKQLRVEKSEAATQIETMRGELLKKAEELDDIDSLKKVVKNLPDTAYRVIPSGLKTILSKYRG